MTSLVSQLYLADASRLLIQNIKYDIVALEEDLKNSHRQLEDSTRRVSGYEKHVLQTQEKYQQHATQLGVDTSRRNIQAQIRMKTHELPDMLQNVLVLTQSPLIHDAVQYYRAFVKFTVQQSSHCGAATQCAETLMHSLMQIIEQKDATLPHEREEIKKFCDDAGEDGNAIPDSSGVIELDWGMSSAVDDEAAVDIDWDMVNDEQWEITIEKSGGSMAEDSDQVTIISCIGFVFIYLF